MNILFVKPYWPYPYGKNENTYNRIWPPLSLANCAAILETQGHKVRILDAHALRIVPQRIKSYINGFDKIFITSSSLDRWQCPNLDISSFLEAVRQIREMTEEIYIMGYHGTVDPMNILGMTKAKAVIRNEPENIVAKICQNKYFLEINGLSYIRDNKLVNNPDGQDFDLKTLPLPAYHLLDAKKYSYEILGKNLALFEISRGCKYDCQFCSRIMYGQKLRVKSKEQIIEEIRASVEDHGVKNGYFIDLQFLSNKELVSQVCDFLISKKYNFTWCCQTRPDSLDIEILVKMKKAGCKIIHFGIETGLQEYLDLIKKNITLTKIKESVKMCEEVGMQTLAFYVFGFRGETAEDREETFKFAKRLNTDFVSFHKVYPYGQNEICLPDIECNKEIDLFIRKKFINYYLRLSYLRKINLFMAIRCLKLFLGRLKTLL